MVTAIGNGLWLHTAWADNAQGSVGFSLTFVEGKAYVGTFTNDNATEEQSAVMYTWAKLNSEDSEETQTQTEEVQTVTKRRVADHASEIENQMIDQDSIADGIGDTVNYFFYDNDGAHVSTVEGDATTGNNVLINANGMDIRSGTDVMATFGSNAVILGESGESQVVVNPSDIIMRDVSGSEMVIHNNNGAFTLDFGGEFETFLSATNALFSIHTTDNDGVYYPQISLEAIDKTYTEKSMGIDITGDSVSVTSDGSDIFTFNHDGSWTQKISMVTVSRTFTAQSAGARSYFQVSWGGDLGTTPFSVIVHTGSVAALAGAQFTPVNVSSTGAYINYYCPAATQQATLTIRAYYYE